MAKEDSGGGGSAIQWTTLIAIIVAIGGAWIAYSPLDSARPETSGWGLNQSAGWQDVPARLWQDPFKIQLPESGDAAEIDSKHNNTAEDDRKHPLDELRQQIKDRLPGTDDKNASDDKVMVLAVMVPAGQYAELLERRLRSRVAVVEGLTRCGLEAEDEEHIGYIQTPWTWTGSSPDELNSLKSLSIETPDATRESPHREFSSPLARLKMRLAESLSNLIHGIPAATTRTPPPAESTKDASALLAVPYEWYKPSAVPLSGPRLIEAKPSPTLVVWINEDAMGNHPLARLWTIFHRLLAGDGEPDRSITIHPANIIFKTIGPYSSTTLRAMVDEALNEKESNANGPIPFLDKVTMYSPSATAEESILLSDAPGKSRNLPDNIKTVTALLAKDTGLTLIRTTATDDSVAHSLVDELNLRFPGNAAQANGTLNPDIHVALVSELDTFYGRALPVSFMAAAMGKPVPLDGENPDADRIRCFVYLRGIDGKTPAAQEGASHEGTAASTEGDSSNPLAGPNKLTGPDEKPEGTNQADYLRRLADRLAFWDAQIAKYSRPSFSTSHGAGLQAVGVMGSDVYDTLLILRALRDRLPNVVFFTTNMDARYTMESEWRNSRNLLIVSPFGLRLEGKYQADIPPFRDCYQTAEFGATIAAMGGIPQFVDSDRDAALGAPRRFEIGRQGPFDLTVRDSHEAEQDNQRLQLEENAGGDEANNSHLTSHGELPSKDSNFKCIQPEPQSLLQFREAGFWNWIYAILLLGGMAWMVETTRRLERKSFHEHEKPPAFPWWGRPAMFLAFSIAAFAILLYIVWGAPYRDGDRGVPLALFEGLSIWPSEILRIISIVLGVFLFYITISETASNDRDVRKHFGLKRDCGLGNGWFWKLAFWKWKVFYDPYNPSSDWESLYKKGYRVDATRLWSEYKRRAEFYPRIVRVVGWTCLYMAFLGFLIYATGMPRSPVRGETAACWDKLIMFACIFFQAVFTIFVVDGTYLNKQLIDHLARTETNWPPTALSSINLIHLPVQDIAEYLDVRFIAMRTRVVEKVVYYPFLILFILIAARNDGFAAWPWTPALMTGFSISLIAAVTAPLMLRGAANKARVEALRRLNHRRLVLANDPGRAAILKEVTQLVQNEKEGAFTLLSNHPYLRAAMLSFGSAGIWAVLDYMGKFGH